MNLFALALYIPTGRTGTFERYSETLEIWADDEEAAKQAAGVYLSIRCRLPTRMELVSSPDSENNSEQSQIATNTE